MKLKLSKIHLEKISKSKFNKINDRSLIRCNRYIEAIFSALSIRDSKVAPTIHAVTPDEECDLDFVPNKAEDLDITYAMSNSLGFGGHNAVLKEISRLIEHK